MESWLIPIRFLHVGAGSAWFGEVVVINFILIPIVGRLDAEARRRFVSHVFPQVFRLASVLSATTALAGLTLLLMTTRGDLSMLTASRWGHGILVGGSLGLLLTLFHFFMENRLAKRIGIGCDGPSPSDAALSDVHAKLTVVPRLGLLVISTIFFSMMYAVRGI